MGEESTFLGLVADDRIVFPNKGDGTPRKKYFRKERELEGQSATNWWPHDQFGNNQAGNREVESLFGIKNVFSNPKPIDLIKGILDISNVKDGDIVLDFFAGSGTTGHAIMLENEKDGGKRKFVLVNISERVNEKSVAFSEGYREVSEITRARLNKVAKQLKSAKSQGLRCLKVSGSNFISFNMLGNEDQLALYESTLTTDLDVESVAVEVFLKNGVRLDSQWLRPSEYNGNIVISEQVCVVATLDLSMRIIESLISNYNARIIVLLEDAFAGKDDLKANMYFTCKNSNVTMKTI
jgi:adenine-specific DNA-methyltransferase